MRPELRAVMRENRGPFTRQQAVAAGYRERELKTLTGHRGDWVVVRRGTYVERDLYESLSEDQRYAMRVRAAVLTSTLPAIVSHSSSAVLLGFPMRPWQRDVVHLTRPGVSGGRSEGGVKHHLAGYGAWDVRVVDGLAVTSPARTAADVAREYGFVDGVVAADHALGHGATMADLRTCLALMTCWPNVTMVRAAVDAADGGAQSIGETLLRLMVVELDIGRPVTQYLVSERGRTAFIDLRVGRHLFEFDGRVKYLGRDAGGYASGRVEDVLWAEKLREDWVRNAQGGFGMSRVTWSELQPRSWEATKERLRREFAGTVRRLGLGLDLDFPSVVDAQRGA